jgi:hypothetical protein
MQAKHANILTFFGACVVIQRVDYLFAENGLVAYKDGQLLSIQVRNQNTL